MKILEPNIFSIEELTPKNREFFASKVISICDDQNITINDRFIIEVLWKNYGKILFLGKIRKGDKERIGEKDECKAKFF